LFDRSVDYEFFELGKLILDAPDVEFDANTVFSCTFEIGNTKHKYGRKIYSFFDWLAHSGGLLDVTERFFGAVVGFFSIRIFYLDLASVMF
jgi:hypothetical protein